MDYLQKWNRIKQWFRCLRAGHDWEQVFFDLGRCKQCGVQLFTVEMNPRDMIAFIKRFRRVR